MVSCSAVQARNCLGYILSRTFRSFHCRSRRCESSCPQARSRCRLTMAVTAFLEMPRLRERSGTARRLGSVSAASVAASDSSSVPGCLAAKLRASSNHVMWAPGQYQRGMRASPQARFVGRCRGRQTTAAPPDARGSNGALPLSRLLWQRSPRRTATNSNRVVRTAAGPAASTARAIPLLKHLTPCAGSGPHCRGWQNAHTAVISHPAQVNLSRNPTNLPCRKQRFQEGTLPQSPGKQELLQGCREREGMLQAVPDSKLSDADRVRNRSPAPRQNNLQTRNRDSWTNGQLPVQLLLEATNTCVACQVIQLGAFRFRKCVRTPVGISICIPIAR